MKKIILTSIIASLCLSLNANAQVTSNFQATSTVASKCFVSSENINFGNLDLFSTSVVEATGTVKVLCSNGVTYTVTPDDGWEDGRVQAIHNQNNENDSAIVVLLDKTAGGVWNRTNGFTATGNGLEQSHAISAKYRNTEQAKAYLGYISNQYNYQATPGEYSGGVNVTVTY